MKHIHFHRYEAYTFPSGKISNFLYAEQYFNQIPFKTSFSRYERLKYYVMCKIDAVPTDEKEVNENSQIVDGKRVFEFEAATTKTDLFYGTRNINEEVLRLNNEAKLTNFEELNSIITLFDKKD